MNIADPAAWGDQRPVVPEGYTVSAIATDLNPGSSYSEELPLQMWLATTHYGMTVAETWLVGAVECARRLVRDWRLTPHEVLTGGSFSLCLRSKTDPRYPKYPRIPVARCPGFQAAKAASRMVAFSVRGSGG